MAVGQAKNLANKLGNALKNATSRPKRAPRPPQLGVEVTDGPRVLSKRLQGARSGSTRFTTRRTNSTHLLPRWLARAGLGSWALIGILAVIGFCVYAISQVSAVFVALFLALIMTSILAPVVNFLDRWINRWIAVFTAVLLFFGVIVGLISLVVTSVATSWPTLAAQFGNGVDIIVDFTHNLPFNIQLTQADISEWANEMVAKGQAYITTNWSTLAGDVVSNVSSAALAFTIVVLAIFSTLFFLHDGSAMWRWFLNLIPQARRETTHRAAWAGWQTFSSYARGTMIVAGTDGVMAGIFLQIIGVPLAPALGILVFMGAFIPLVGAPTAMIVAMIVALATGGVMKALLVGLGIALIGQLEGHVLQPLIMGHQVSLHPAVVGIGVAVGTFTAGLLGAVIAIPVIGVIWAVFKELYQPDDPVQGKLEAPLTKKDREVMRKKLLKSQKTSSQTL